MISPLKFTLLWVTYVAEVIGGLYTDHHRHGRTDGDSKRYDELLSAIRDAAASMEIENWIFEIEKSVFWTSRRRSCQPQPDSSLSDFHSPIFMISVGARMKE